MKARSLFSSLLIVLTFATAPLVRGDSDTPFIDHRIKTSQERLNADVKEGKLTKIDSDELQQQLDHIKKLKERATSTGTPTGRTRYDIRQDLDLFEKDITRREKHAAKAAGSASASPSATP